MLYNYRYVDMLNGTYQIERYGLGNNATIMTGVPSEGLAHQIAQALIRETNEMSTDARNEAVNDIRRDLYDHFKDIPGVFKTDNYRNLSILGVLEYCQKAIPRYRKMLAEMTGWGDWLKNGYDLKEYDAIMALYPRNDEEPDTTK